MWWILASAILIGVNAAPYDDQTARWLIPLAAAAYAPTANECIAKHYNNTEVVKQIEVYCDVTQNDTCGAYLALLHDDKIIALVFRGTKTNKQMLLEIGSGFSEKKDFRQMGMINSYFHDAFFSLWTRLLTRPLHSLIRKYPTYTVAVLGHSLGAALSSLASVELVSTGVLNADNSIHYNFGQPRVGDFQFAMAHTELIPDFYRVTHAQDLISDNFVVELGYWHHSNQVWYPHEMDVNSQFIICPLEFDINCWGPPRLSMPDHRTYFNIVVPDFYKTGC
ncbi:Lipase-3 domain-containing protein [Aphelenchoides besseyi]|nr:Lipase-3 domain-containing protein [Aphelenchoides besseyi]